MGFKINKYDRCVANKVIDGKKYTICWYVDDNNISHVDPKVVDEMIKKIEENFGKMTVTRGKEHNFVGIDLVFKEDGTVEIFMKEYIKEYIDTFDKVMKKANTPTKHDLFYVKDEL